MPLPNREPDAARFSVRAMHGHDLANQLPRLPRHIIERPRLLDALDARSPLTVIRGPLGFGKTTLVLDWLRAGGSDELLAWMTVDSDSQARDEFWGEVVDALTAAGVGQHIDHPARSLRGRAARMIRASVRPVLLIIDRFEAIQADGIDRELLDLVRSTSRLRVIACLRTHRHFAPSALVDIDATTIDAQDLLLTRAETRSLLTELELGLSEAELDTLMKQTGGWPEPTRAAALALVKDGATRDVIATTDVIGAQYLRDRLLPEAHRPDLVRFAMLTAIPEPLSAQTAAVVTGDQSPETLLTRLEEQGFLTARTTADETVFHWPEAGRQALLAELRRQMPAARIDGLRSTLALWYLSHDQAEAALIQAMDARDWQLVTTIVETSWLSLLTEHRDVLRKALIATPDEIIASSARAVAARDILLRAPDDLLLHVSRRTRDTLPGDGSHVTDVGDVLDASTAIMIALRRRGLFADANAHAERVQGTVTLTRLGHPVSALPALSSLALQIGIGEMLTGNLTPAIDSLTFAWKTAFGDSRAVTERDSAGKLALVYAINGDVRAAKQWLKRHTAARHPGGWLQATTASTGMIADALVALERHDAAAAAIDILAEAEVVDEFWAYLEYVVAQCAIEEGNSSDMLARLDRARQAHRHWMTPGAVAGPMLASAEADLLMAAGHGHQALSVLESTDSGHELVRVSRARLALLTGDTAGAAVSGIDSVWHRSASTRARVEMLLINAVAAERAGRPADAERILQRAINSATRAGLRRPFSTVPQADLAVITARLPAVSDELKDAMLPRRQLYPERLRMVVLSERERRVLEQAVAGLTIQQIARALFVSANTVKSQLKSLYRKLDVSTRPEAIARAASWGLLDPTPPSNPHSHS